MKIDCYSALAGFEMPSQNHSPPPNINPLPFRGSEEHDKHYEILPKRAQATNSKYFHEAYSFIGGPRSPCNLIKTSRAATTLLELHQCFEYTNSHGQCPGVYTRRLYYLGNCVAFERMGMQWHEGQDIIGVAHGALTAKPCSVSQDQRNYMRIFNPEKENLRIF
jgi:hypothetical protein